MFVHAAGLGHGSAHVGLHPVAQGHAVVKSRAYRAMLSIRHKIIQFSSENIDIKCGNVSTYDNTNDYKFL